MEFNELHMIFIFDDRCIVGGSIYSNTIAMAFLPGEVALDRHVQLEKERTKTPASGLNLAQA